MEAERTAKSEYARAWARATRVLTLRDHSRDELEHKLRHRQFSPEVIARVLADAETQGLIASDEALATRQRELFDRRLKSRRFIEEQLRLKRLPIPAPEADDVELAKIRELVARKFGEPAGLTFDDRARAVRFLKYRGFEDRLIHVVLNHAE